LLLIDLQRDFCHKEGSLYVVGRSGMGAIDDNARIAEFIYRNLGAITDITTTLDTHFPYQIFIPEFWVDENGNPLQAHTIIDVAPNGRGLINLDLAGNVIHEDVKPNPSIAWWLCKGNYPWLVRQVEFYCQELAKVGKYKLYLWPQHCILGSQGHTLAGIIHEARMFHAYARDSQAWIEVKGGHPLSENYSVLRPEVLLSHDGSALTQRNAAFFNKLISADVLIIAGQAASHCVAWTIKDLLAEIMAQDPDLAKKVYVMSDCTSSVVVPGADFTDQANEAMDQFAKAGMNIVKSADPIESWPGIQN
jgi:nicotinamidase-related amidase